MDILDSWVAFVSIVVIVVGFVGILVSQLVIAFGWWSPVVFAGACVIGGGLYRLATIIERTY